MGGLRGGHSGTDIQKGRGNAIQILGQAVRTLISAIPGVRLSTFQGGSKRNAIAREAEAVVLIPEDRLHQAGELASLVAKEVIQALSPVEPDLKITLEPAAGNFRAIHAAQTSRILDTLLAMPHGVLRMSSDIDGLVETSTNLATVVMEDGTLVVGTSQRSLIESAKKEAIRKVQASLRLGGFSVKSGAGYPGWKPNLSSKLLAAFCASYEELFQKKPEVLAIHAGLECGLIGEVFPGMDMISIGPTILDPHSPAERLNVPDVRKFWKTLLPQAPVEDEGCASEEDAQGDEERHGVRLEDVPGDLPRVENVVQHHLIEARPELVEIEVFGAGLEGRQGEDGAGQNSARGEASAPGSQRGRGEKNRETCVAGNAREECHEAGRPGPGPRQEKNPQERPQPQKSGDARQADALGDSGEAGSDGDAGAVHVAAARGLLRCFVRHRHVPAAHRFSERALWRAASQERRPRKKAAAVSLGLGRLQTRWDFL